MNTHPRVSVAVPLFNEEEGIPELVRRIGAVLHSLPGGPHEMLFVDDGSSDGTLTALQAEAEKDARIVLISLSRNFGHQAALTAALDNVTGDVAVLMDGDLQDPPEVIPDFLSMFASGYDVVYAERAGRQEPWWLRTCYFVFYRLISRMSKLKMPMDAGDFSLLSRRVIDELRRAREFHRYLRGLRTWVGFRQTGIAVERSERYAGTSKYSIASLVGLALDGIFSFSALPLRLATLLGAIAVVLSSSVGAYAVYAALFLDRSPQGFTTQIVTIVFLSGVNLFFLGIIGEYVGRLYDESKARPVYVIDSIRQGSHPSRSETGGP